MVTDTHGGYKLIWCGSGSSFGSLVDHTLTSSRPRFARLVVRFCSFETAPNTAFERDALKRAPQFER